MSNDTNLEASVIAALCNDPDIDDEMRQLALALLAELAQPATAGDTLPVMSNTWTTDNRWSAGASGVTVPDTAPAAYSARWIDHGSRADIVPDRQGFAYNDTADRDRLIALLSDAAMHANMPCLDRDVVTCVMRRPDTGIVMWARRSGGYVYVDAWLYPLPVECVYCGKSVHDEDGMLVDDETGGDVCGSWGTYGNEPHMIEAVIVTTDRRAAIVRGGDRERVAAYLPDGYEVCTEVTDGVLIAGRDEAGWTLDGYVLPRLASGLMFGNEVAVIDCADCGDCPVWADGDVCEACEARQG